jgi:hypothetical protein
MEVANFKAKIAGRKEIIYFEDYWHRAEDRPERPIRDNVDLYRSRLTDVTSWLRIHLVISHYRILSDFEKSKKILFWKITE